MLATFPPWRYPHLFKLWQNWQATEQGHQLDRWLERQFRRNKQFGKNDRNAYREAFFAAMRYLQLAQALEHSYQQGETDWQKWDEHWQYEAQPIAPASFWYWILLRAGIETSPPRELSDGGARLQYFQNLAQQWPSDSLLSPRQLLWHGYQPSLAGALKKRQQLSNWSNSDLATFIEQSNTPAPVCLRPQNCSAAELATQLKAEGIDTDHQALGLTVRGKLNVNNSQAYLDGKFELQDTASQVLATAVALGPYESLWDVCAGAGGKTLAFAAAAPTSVILATDIRSNALNQLTTRQKRAKFTNINALQHDASQLLAPELVPDKGFDWIFIDAPCSAAGTWRRAADARWRMAELDPLIQLQQTILAQAATALSLGGHIIYATCSWLNTENEQQVDHFLAHHLAFTLIEQTCVGSPAIDADTMFYAHLVRNQRPT